MMSKTAWQKAMGKNIYRNRNKWRIIRKGKNYGTYDTFDEAMKARDELIENDWDDTTIRERKRQKEYYTGLSRRSYRYAIIAPKGQYAGMCKTIEEALYYRDIIYDLYNNGADITGKRPDDYDLNNDNPYSDGLKYPVPERLTIPSTRKQDSGFIAVKGEQSYHIWHSGDYICACRTYEQAYYVRQELQRCDWDIRELDRILENYPVWYTWLMGFWRYVIPVEDYWKVVIPPKRSRTGKLEPIIFNNVRDALWERDLLLRYDFDEELIVYLADDNENPYYDMDLPPYPQRKIKNNKVREPRTDLFNKAFEIVQDYPEIGQTELCRSIGISATAFRILLNKEYDISYADFIRICNAGENPNDVLEQKPLIFNPDLEYHRNGKYYQKFGDKYEVRKWIDGRTVTFGRYPNKELADKVIKDLKKCDWDKSELKKIQSKHGFRSVHLSKRNVYSRVIHVKSTDEDKTFWEVRKKIQGKSEYFGFYEDKRTACLVRDIMTVKGWSLELLDNVRDFAEYVVSLIDDCWRCNTDKFI